MLLESQNSLIPKIFPNFWAFRGLLGILGPATIVAVSPPLDGPAAVVNDIECFDKAEC